MKKKSVIRKMVTITGLIIAALFVILVELTVNTVDKSSRETADADISIIASSYSTYVTTWLDENLNLLDFYLYLYHLVQNFYFLSRCTVFISFF